MINLARERLLIRSIESLLKRCMAKAMDTEEVAHEIYKTIILPMHDDLRDEWVALVRTEEGDPQ